MPETFHPIFFDCVVENSPALGKNKTGTGQEVQLRG